MVFKINIKALISIITAKAIIKLSKVLFKGGTNFPGKVALKLDNNILSTVSKNYEVILITGTNGKTTTTSMVYNILKESNKKVITNNTGANMLPGIVACFVENFSFKKVKTVQYAVIEADEANVPLVTQYITPKVITITNLFRDQMDRYGEVYTTLKKILDGIVKVPETTLVLNGDESLLGDLNVQNKCIYYGFKSYKDDNKEIDINADAKFCKKCKAPYSYDFITYNHLGSFYCPNCGYKRPDLSYYVDSVIEQTSKGSLVSINDEEYEINQPGTYNIYNALCAYSIASTLDVEACIIQKSLKSTVSSFGRQESLTIKDKDVKIILVKNPAGFDEALKTISLDKNNVSAAFLLNDNYADGRDVSWIWDVNFEDLSKLELSKIMISGIRMYDMAIRLKVAGLSKENFVLCESYDKLLEEITVCNTSTIYVLATYTAMISFRKYLHGKGYIKNLW